MNNRKLTGRKIFEGQEAYRRDIRRERNARIKKLFLKIFVVLIGMFGLAPAWGDHFVDWFLKPELVENWPLVISGIVVVFFSLATLFAGRKKWPGILLAIATGTELMLWARVFLTQHQFKVLGTAIFSAGGIIIMMILFGFYLVITWRSLFPRWPDLCGGR